MSAGCRAKLRQAEKKMSCSWQSSAERSKSPRTGAKTGAPRPHCGDQLPSRRKVASTRARVKLPFLIRSKNAHIALPCGSFIEGSILTRGAGAFGPPVIDKLFFFVIFDEVVVIDHCRGRRWPCEYDLTIWGFEKFSIKDAGAAFRLVAFGFIAHIEHAD